jgi:hypothetical protein
MAARQGIVVKKSRTRDPQADGYGEWYAFDVSQDTIGHKIALADGKRQPDEVFVALDHMERWLNRQPG